MKKLFLISALTVVLLSIIVSGCSKNRTTVTTTDGIPLRKGATTIYTNLSVPAWILYSTDEFSSIGIARDFIKDGKAPTFTAKEFALQSQALNFGTFSFNKERLAGLPTEFKDEEPIADLGLEPVANPDRAKEQAEKLKPVAEASVSGYKFILLGNPDSKINQDPVTVSAATLPEWCMEKEVWEGEKYFYAVGAGEASTLTEAWNQAQKRALIKLAYHALRDLRPELHMEKELEEKVFQMEKTLSNLNISFDKNWLFHRTVDAKDFYNVYIMLKINK